MGEFISSMDRGSLAHILCMFPSEGLESLGFQTQGLPSLGVEDEHPGLWVPVSTCYPAGSTEGIGLE